MAIAAIPASVGLIAASFARAVVATLGIGGGWVQPDCSRWCNIPAAFEGRRRIRGKSSTHLHRFVRARRSLALLFCRLHADPALRGGARGQTAPHRPNLEYLRGQSKRLLTDLKKGNPKAKLAEAQLNIARDSGFTSWPALAKHVEQLRALEGEWSFESACKSTAATCRRPMSAESRLLIDGDRFRMESPGRITTDLHDRRVRGPAHIDIEFVEGGGRQLVVRHYELSGDQLDDLSRALSVPRVQGVRDRSRQRSRAERLRARRPHPSRTKVTGGVTQQRKARAFAATANRSFDVTMTPS